MTNLALSYLVMVHNGAELELPQVSRFDSGVYYCMATNGVPPTVSKSVRLYVDCETFNHNDVMPFL